MEWTWDLVKAVANRRKHGLSFDAALQVFDDPFQINDADPHPDGDRWQTIGRVHNTVVFVVHTWPDLDGPGRIISARKAIPSERRRYGGADA